jgi:hypothetical protein
MIIEKQPGGCIRLLHEVEEISKKYLLISDVHFDSPKCERKLFKQHMDQAKDQGAGVLCFGDFFDAMQGRDDRRRNKSDLREENKRADYLDSLVEEAVEFLTPYRDNLVMFSQGNHESGLLNKMETDLLKRLTRDLGGNVQYGPYQGFIRFQHLVTATSRRTTTMFFHHGGFHGAITKGVLSVNRYAAIAPDADIVVSADSHDRWCVEHPMYRLSQNGAYKVVPQLHIKVGNYKNEYTSGSGWAIEKIVFPKAIGGQWLTFSIENGDVRARATMT